VKLPLKNSKGGAVGEVEVRDDVFGKPMNAAVIHQVMVGQLANRRQGTAKTKTRSEVSGGGAKPRPQKYTGRARQGSIRSPQWKGGGTVFGPIPRSYHQRTPRRMRRLSLVTTLSGKVKEGELVVVDQLALDQPKTKDMVQVLSALSSGASVLLVADGVNPEVLRCARNIPKVKTVPSHALNTLDLLNHRTIIMTLDAVRGAETLWGGSFVRKRQISESDVEADDSELDAEDAGQAADVAATEPEAVVESAEDDVAVDEAEASVETEESADEAEASAEAVEETESDSGEEPDDTEDETVEK
tara:strand:- start:3174 stop:4076 length:903 start_codon:yes stop_codon:yes gene_type:complete